MLLPLPGADSTFSLAPSNTSLGDTGPSQSPPPDSSSLSTAAVAGVVSGGVVAVLLLLLLGAWAWRTHQTQHAALYAAKHDDDDTGTLPPLTTSGQQLSLTISPAPTDSTATSTSTAQTHRAALKNAVGSSHLATAGDSQAVKLSTSPPSGGAVTHHWRCSRTQFQPRHHHLLPSAPHHLD